MVKPAMYLWDGSQLVNALLQLAFVHTTPKQLSRPSYAPTEDGDDAFKDGFYNQLQDTITEIPQHDVKLVLGDFNTMLSNNREGNEHIIDSFGS